jgi:hypothetical protein
MNSENCAWLFLAQGFATHCPLCLLTSSDRGLRMPVAPPQREKFSQGKLRSCLKFIEPHLYLLCLSSKCSSLSSGVILFSLCFSKDSSQKVHSDFAPVLELPWFSEDRSLGPVNAWSVPLLPQGWDQGQNMEDTVLVCWSRRNTHTHTHPAFRTQCLLL